MIKYDSVQELVNEAIRRQRNISALVLEEQAVHLDLAPGEIVRRMTDNYQVMKASIRTGIHSDSKSSSGLTGGDAHRLKQYMEAQDTLGGRTMNRAVMRAIAVAEVNACMGRIVASPTAGSCGILPAVLSTIQEERGLSDSRVVMAMFTAAGFGMVIANRASISGAEGGCQAECGSASAMAAAAAVELAGGSPGMAAHACAIALKNVLGLVCDPVAGLVEVPCVKRNAMGAANALSAADMALAGIESFIPADEVIDAMKSVADLMPAALKETAEGGLAATPTGRRIASAFQNAD